MYPAPQLDAADSSLPTPGERHRTQPPALAQAQTCQALWGAHGGRGAGGEVIARVIRGVDLRRGREERGPPGGRSGAGLSVAGPAIRHLPIHTKPHRGQCLPKGVPRTAGRGPSGTCGWTVSQPWGCGSPGAQAGLGGPGGRAAPHAQPPAGAPARPWAAPAPGLVSA